MNKKNYWIVVMDTVTAKIYATSSLQLIEPLDSIAELNHPEGYKKIKIWFQMLQVIIRWTMLHPGVMRINLLLKK